MLIKITYRDGSEREDHSYGSVEELIASHFHNGELPEGTLVEEVKPATAEVKKAKK